MSTSLFLALSVAIASFAATAQPAEVVVRIQVTDRSEETIAAAAREVLQQTLLLRSGDRDLLAHPTISAALDDARSQLSLYQFEQIEGRTRFVAQIDPEAIDNLIEKPTARCGLRRATSAHVAGGGRYRGPSLWQHR